MRRFAELFIALAATTYLLGLLIIFLADVHGVVLPETISTALILMSSSGLAVTVSFGTAFLAGTGHRRPWITVVWCVVLFLLSFLLWPYFRSGIAGTPYEEALLRLHPAAPDLFAWLGVGIGEIMLALVFFNRGSGGSSGASAGISGDEWTDLLNTVTKLSLELDALKNSGGAPEPSGGIPEETKGTPDPSEDSGGSSEDHRTNRERVLAALAALGDADAPTLSDVTGLTVGQVNNALKGNDQIEREPITQPSRWRGRTLYRLKKGDRT